MTILAVLLGGALGTGLRLALDALLPHADAGFPWSTLLANVAGSFLLGLLVGRFEFSTPVWARAGLRTGVLGSFTTFSALAVSFVALVDTAQWGLALAYLGATLLLGLAAAALGLGIGTRRRMPPLQVTE
ncbi:CrcB family protein [uncultured Schumannella sp.]|uniref:fluoride efflux transporter FluC n=1 Tax=uncultured Schumannella sp. TaxID=1195956 RepID=UPI0025D068AA|nr:CrcB family protein [uncultured Schumannella sp.]